MTPQNYESGFQPSARGPSNPASGFQQAPQSSGFGFQQMSSSGGFAESAQRAPQAGFFPIQSGSTSNPKPAFGPSSDFGPSNNPPTSFNSAAPQSFSRGFSQQPPQHSNFTPPPQSNNRPEVTYTPQQEQSSVTASSMFSEDSELSAEERAAYTSPAFRLGAVPLHAPTQSIAQS